MDGNGDGDGDDDIYNGGAFVCVYVTFLLILPSPCPAGQSWTIYMLPKSHSTGTCPLSLVRERAAFHYTFDIDHYTFRAYHNDEDCQDDDDRLRSVNIYCFRAEGRPGPS